MNTMLAAVIAVVVGATTPAAVYQRTTSREIPMRVRDVSDVVNSDHTLALVGEPAVFARARVERIAGPRSFWIGRSGRRVLVVVDAMSVNQMLGHQLRAGDMVRIDGIVERVPGAQHTVNVISWGRLDNADAQALARRDVYVYARRASRVAWTPAPVAATK